MRTLVGAIVGTLAACGVWIAVAGFRGVTIPDRPARAISVDGLWWRLALVIAGFTAAFAVTGWPAAGVLAGACAWVAPMLVGVRAHRDRLTRRSDAVASWTEMLRDTIASHAGLQEAIAVSARVAPAPIRAEVQALAIRAERETLSAALRRFAADIEDPVADLVVASLVIAADGKPNVSPTCWDRSQTLHVSRLRCAYALRRDVPAPTRRRGRWSPSPSGSQSCCCCSHLRSWNRMTRRPGRSC